MTRNFKPFHGVTHDPTFLVAKGRFDVPAQDELRSILEECRVLVVDQGVKPDSSEIKQLQNTARNVERRIEQEQKEAERKHIKKLASAISMAVDRHRKATLRSVGQRASYNAQKAVAIATDYCKERGVSLCVRHEFDSGNIGTLQDSSHAENVTAMVMRIQIHEGETNG